MVKRIVCNTIEEKAFNEKYMKVPRVDNRLQYLARCCLYRIHKGTCCIASTAMFDAIKTKKINLRSNSAAIGASWGQQGVIVATTNVCDCGSLLELRPRKIIDLNLNANDRRRNRRLATSSIALVAPNLASTIIKRRGCSYILCNINVSLFPLDDNYLAIFKTFMVA